MKTKTVENPEQDLRDTLSTQAITHSTALLNQSSSQGEQAHFCSKMIDDLVFIKNWSFSRVARRCSVSVSTIQKLHQGRTKHPRFSTFNRLLILHHRVFFVSPAK